MPKEQKKAAVVKATAGQPEAESDWGDTKANVSSNAAPDEKVTPLPASPQAALGVAATVPETQPEPQNTSTAGQPEAESVKLPDPVIEEDDGERLPTEGDFKFPNDLNKSLALLAEATAFPTSTHRQQRFRATALAAIRKHVFQLQQGSPVVEMDATHIAKAAPSHETLRRHRLETVARHMPEVKELLADYDKLVQEVKDLNELLGKS